jgi:hypothetical protein
LTTRTPHVGLVRTNNGPHGRKKPPERSAVSFLKKKNVRPLVLFQPHHPRPRGDRYLPAVPVARRSFLVRGQDPSRGHPRRPRPRIGRRPGLRVRSWGRETPPVAGGTPKEWNGVRPRHPRAKALRLLTRHAYALSH